MKVPIKKIEVIGLIEDSLNSNHDVIVTFDDDSKYVATFFTPLNILYLMDYYKHYSRENNNGDFFWSSDMVIVRRIEISVITSSIECMLSDETFYNIFHEIREYKEEWVIPL